MGKTGLFSAILSAFVVETYQNLQPASDLTTQQLLAYGFSYQRAYNPIPAFLNDTMNSLLSPAPFVAPTSARWINALFFISLILSLAAALFGIMGKQWLREYMAWNSSLAQPRENVLVRQIRREEWDASYAETIIRSIPALLELAMILFLAGVVGLLWTLDQIVAKVVTAFVAAFVILLAILTIHPLFRRRSPYKSPTSWALVYAFSAGENLAHFVGQCFITYIDFVQRLRAELRTNGDVTWQELFMYAITLQQPGWWNSRPWVRPTFSALLKSWRERDLESCRIKNLPAAHWWQKSHDAKAAAKRELAHEKAHLNPEGEFIGTPNPDNINDDVSDAFLVNLSEAPRLLRALSWVQLASQDIHLENNLRICLETVHSDALTSLDEEARTNIRMVTLWCIATSVRINTNIHYPELCLSIAAQPGLTTGIISSFRTRLLQSTQDNGSPCFAWPHNTSAKVMAAPLVAVLPRFLDLELERLETESTSPLPDASSATATRRILDIIQNMAFTSESPGRISRFSRAWVARGDARERVKHLAHITGIPAQYHAMILHDYFSVESLYPDGALDNRAVARFIDAVTRWLESDFKFSCDIATQVRVLDWVTGVVSAALTRGLRRICYSDDEDDDQWIQKLFYQRDHFSKNCGPAFRRLLHVFEELYCRSLLVGDNNSISQRITRCQCAAHSDMEHCEVQDCNWIGE